MQAVLGIDAAWTATNPSGIALVKEGSTGWHLIAVESSYQRFLALADKTMPPEIKSTGSRPAPAALLAAASIIAGRTVDLVTVDMPMAHSKIERRRVSDNRVSSAYGGRGAGTHSANADRPGKISDALKADFMVAGYPLQTLSIAAPGLIEVYPHPALIELLNLEERLKYKAAKVSRYWTDLSPSDRRLELLKNWGLVVAALDLEIAGIADAFPIADAQLTGWALKAEEDKLDAVICAWVGICALEGRASPYGDADSAIWIPDKVRDQR